MFPLNCKRVDLPPRTTKLIFFFIGSIWFGENDNFISLTWLQMNSFHYVRVKKNYESFQSLISVGKEAISMVYILS